MVIFADKLSDLSTATHHPVWQFATLNANQLVFVASFSKSAGMILTPFESRVFMCSMGQIAELYWQQIDHYAYWFGRATLLMLQRPRETLYLHFAFILNLINILT